MSKVVLYMSMSVDGFIAGPDDGPGSGLGVGGERLHDWLGAGGIDPGTYRPAGDGPSAMVFDEMMATGAVITGRRTFDHAGRWAGRPPRRRPGLRPDPRRPRRPAAGQRPLRHRRRRVRGAGPRRGRGRDVWCTGPAPPRRCLRIGELDELELHVVPVLLGQGRRLFDHLPAEHIELDLLRRLTPDDGDLAHRVMHLRYRVHARSDFISSLDGYAAAEGWPYGYGASTRAVSAVSSVPRYQVILSSRKRHQWCRSIVALRPVAFTVNPKRMTAMTSVSLAANASGVNSVTSRVSAIAAKKPGSSVLAAADAVPGRDGAGRLGCPVDVVGDDVEDRGDVAAAERVVDGLDGLDLGIHRVPPRDRVRAGWRSRPPPDIPETRYLSPPARAGAPTR